jgi:hypothetical protein
VKRKLIGVAAIAAAAGVAVPAAGLASADTSGGACTGFDQAIEYHVWRAGTTNGPDGNPTPDAIDSQRYLRTLYGWYHASNCNVALGKNRPFEPPCYLPKGCNGLDSWYGEPPDGPLVVEVQL